MPLKHGPIEGSPSATICMIVIVFSMPLKHGPIEGLIGKRFLKRLVGFSMPLKHGPIEGVRRSVWNVASIVVFHAPKAWPH